WRRGECPERRRDSPLTPRRSAQRGAVHRVSLLLYDERRVRHSVIVVDRAWGRGIGNPNTIVDDEGIPVMSNWNWRGDRPDAAATMLCLERRVRRIPPVEIADDGDLLRV